MLEANDLKQIAEIVSTSIKKEVPPIIREEVPPLIRKELADFWTGNLEPAFDYVHERIDKLEASHNELMATVSNLPTKEYVDDKIAGLKSYFYVKFGKS